MKKEKITVSGTEDSVQVGKCSGTCKIGKLNVVFSTEDMNKVVEKINEIIECKNGN